MLIRRGSRVDVCVWAWSKSATFRAGDDENSRAAIYAAATAAAVAAVAALPTHPRLRSAHEPLRAEPSAEQMTRRRRLS
ncbi:hypothetical protein Y032_0004g1964 [Ancylostoma ceylanicum]|uniref:Uncharacterized protein n=1 Tax=Ancylostoma ceylanicum TaxID=53326 RepID=A0A016VVS1_9BILA|nr:hypothetical protein Y032_0004g1964 [Ancylostoma ceylanicum]